VGFVMVSPSAGSGPLGQTAQGDISAFLRDHHVWFKRNISFISHFV